MESASLGKQHGVKGNREVLVQFSALALMSLRQITCPSKTQFPHLRNGTGNLLGLRGVGRV